VLKLDTAPVPDQADITKKSGYNLLSTSYYHQVAPVHMSGLYDELYKACFAGDKEKIKKLCLPLDGQQSKTSLLCISVDVRDPKQSNSYIHPGMLLFFSFCRFVINDFLGFMPLFDTVAMNTGVTKFKDIATLPFGVESDIHPKTMLQGCFVYCRGRDVRFLQICLRNLSMTKISKHLFILPISTMPYQSCLNFQRICTSVTHFWVPMRWSNSWN